MDAEVPRCPTCGAPVQPNWDWCHLCGYDPEGLRPPGWTPSGPPEAEANGRGAKRAAKPKKEKTKTKTKTKARGKAAVPAPPPQWQPPGQWQPSDVRSPMPSGGPSGSSGADLEQTFHVPPNAFEKLAAVVAVALAALMAYLTGMAVLQIAEGASTSMLDNVATVVFVLVCALIAFALVVQGRAFVRQKVVLTSTEIAAYNRFGRVRRVSRREIHGISMGLRQFQLPGGLTQPMEVPYLQLNDGSGFWLDALGSRTPNSSPSDEQLAMYEQVVAAVESDRQARSHETSTLNI
jgi:hypothetical protein